MRKKRSSEINSQAEPEQTPTMASEPSRRPSRRAAREAVRKIYNVVHNGSSESYQDTTESELKSKRKCDDISLDMQCEDDALSPVQTQFQREAVQMYNLTMRNLRQLQACKNVRIIEERPNQPIASHKTPPAKTRPNQPIALHKTPPAKTKPKGMPLSRALLLQNEANKMSGNVHNGETQIIYL